MSPHHRRARAFTLIELLVVVSVIGMLLGLMLPALGRARDAARIAGCLSRHRELALAASGYADDFGGRFPRSSHSAAVDGLRSWGYTVYPYLTGAPFTSRDGAWYAAMNGIMRCPFDERTFGPDQRGWSYGLNVYHELLPGESRERSFAGRDRLPDPTATILFGEMAATTTADHMMAHFWRLYGADHEVDAERHGLTAAYAYADGHAADTGFTSTYDPARRVDRWNPATAR